MTRTHRSRRVPRGRGRSLLVSVLAMVVAALLVAEGAAWAQTKTIALSMLAGFKEDVLRANLPEFEKKTGIKVQLDVAPIGDLYKKQLLSLSTAARYDAMFMDEPWIAPLSEFLLPLTERARGYDLTDFVPTALAAGAFQGVQYALPVDPNMQLLVYRKDLFDQKGMKPPTTWDELLAAAKAFTDPAKEQYGIAITASSDIQTCLYMLVSMWSQGAELVTAEGKGGVNTPAGRKGAEIYLELLKYASPNARSYTSADVLKAMQTGQAAMAIQWASAAKPLEDPNRSTVAGKLGYTLVPKAVRQTPMRGVWTIGIAKNSSNQDAAWEFAKWLSSKEFGLAAAKFPSALSAIHSPRVSVLQDPGTKAALPYVETLLASLKIAKERPRLREFADIQEHFRVTAGKLTAGELTLDAALKEIDGGTNRILGK
ncbi:MAG TPA: extracellular solute-binding protein [Methylomirabilota bacterium]|nr:extracellular solute-binding protein [Methylomirabilota bacterium]